MAPSPASTHGSPAPVTEFASPSSPAAAYAAPSRVSEDMVLRSIIEGGTRAPMIENVLSSPAAACAAPDRVIKNVASSPAGRRRAKTVQELILEAEMQALLHDADVKAAASLQLLH